MLEPKVSHWASPEDGAHRRPRCRCANGKQNPDFVQKVILTIDGGVRGHYYLSMTLTTEHVQTRPPTWNAAAAAAVQKIETRQSLVPGLALLELRLAFNRVEGYFDISPQDHEKLAELWAAVGHTAMRYAANSGSGFTGEELTSTLVRKQRDYGHDNIQRFGTYGVIVRCHDKIARLENLQATGKDPQNESVRDNIMDVSGYAAIGIMLETGTFGLSLE